MNYMSLSDIEDLKTFQLLLQDLFSELSDVKSGVINTISSIQETNNEPNKNIKTVQNYFLVLTQGFQEILSTLDINPNIAIANFEKEFIIRSKTTKSNAAKKTYFLRIFYKLCSLITSLISLYDYLYHLGYDQHIFREIITELGYKIIDLIKLFNNEFNYLAPDDFFKKVIEEENHINDYDNQDTCIEKEKRKSYMEFRKQILEDTYDKRFNDIEYLRNLLDKCVVTNKKLTFEPVSKNQSKNNSID